MTHLMLMIYGNQLFLPHTKMQAEQHQYLVFQSFCPCGVAAKATRQDTMLRDQEKNKENWLYRIHTETKVEMGWT